MNKLQIILFSVCYLVIGQVSPARADEKILLIASDYLQSDSVPHLANAVHDARNVAEAFRKAGQNQVRLIIEPDINMLNQGIAKFIANLNHDDVAIVYYAGHAIQYRGENYLLAADGISFVSLNSLVKRVSDASKAAVFFIDACRSNPFANSGAGRSVTFSSDDETATRDLQTVDLASLKAEKGLAQLADLRGLSTIVFFSTEPGNVALDGEEGQGSPFAFALVREVNRRQSLDSLLKHTAIDVNRATNGQQSPWRQGDIPFDVFIAGMQTMAIP